MGPPVQVLISSALSRALDHGSRELAKLGLEMVEGPTVSVAPAPGRLRVRVDGPSVLRGVRHGRDIEIVVDQRETVTKVVGAFARFTVESTGNRPRARVGAPGSVVQALKPLRAASRWGGLELRAGDGAICVRRVSTTDNVWLYDLWLIERLADAISASGLPSSPASVGSSPARAD